MMGFTYATLYVMSDPSLREKYNVSLKKWGKLKKLVSSTETSVSKIYIRSFVLVCQMIYISILQYLNSTVRMIDNSTYEVTYVINSRMYKMIVKPVKGPRLILQVRDDSDCDITDVVLQYIGPKYDWHGTAVDPSFFNNSSFLTFELADGTSETLFSRDFLEKKKLTEGEKIDDN